MMKKFATAINCMDGRVQEPVIRFMKEKFGVDYVDMITMPGPDKILGENTDPQTVEATRARIEISVSKHGSETILMAGHGDCAGNPVQKEVHLQQIKESVALVRTWFPEVIVVPVWIDENWVVNPL
jgi:carbonic anhydrase